MADMGIGASVIGAAVIGGETVYVDPNIPSYNQAYTVPVPAQTAEGSLPVVGEADQTLTLALDQVAAIILVGEVAQTIAAPTNATTVEILVAGEAAQDIAVPAQSFEGTTGYYMSAENQLIDVPSQSATGEVPNNGRSELAAGYRVQAKPIIGAFAIGDEIATGESQLASAMVAITQSALVSAPASATLATTIAVPTLDANLRPIVGASHEATLEIDSSSGSGDIDVAALAAVNVDLASQTATGTITVAGSAGNQQVAGATNVATIAAHVGLVGSHTTADATNETAGGPVVVAEHSTTIAVPAITNTFTVFWPVFADQTIDVPAQSFEGDVDVAVDTNQTDAVLPHPTNATATDTLVLGEADQTIPAPAWDVLGGPVVLAEHATSIDVPSQDATSTVFFNFQASQSIAAPEQTVAGDVDVAAASDTTVTLESSGTGDVDYTIVSAQVIELASATARARIYKPATRSRARRYGGTAYPSPTESGYLSWLNQWAS